MLLRTFLLLLIAFSLSAHERHTYQIGQHDYVLVVGSLNEPVVVDDRTGVDLRIKQLVTNNYGVQEKPVEGQESSLKVEIKANGQSKIMDLTPAWKEPGAYRALFYPTAATVYSYRIFGTLGEAPVDLTFTCSNEKYDHHASADTQVIKISDQVTRKQKAGGFGCPLDKTGFRFPQLNTVQ